MPPATSLKKISPNSLSPYGKNEALKETVGFKARFRDKSEQLGPGPSPSPNIDRGPPVLWVNTPVEPGVCAIPGCVHGSASFGLNAPSPARHKEHAVGFPGTPRMTSGVAGIPSPRTLCLTTVHGSVVTVCDFRNLLAGWIPSQF